jgi:hypothetical protein
MGCELWAGTPRFRLDPFASKTDTLANTSPCLARDRDDPCHLRIGLGAYPRRARINPAIDVLTGSRSVSLT